MAAVEAQWLQRQPTDSEVVGSDPTGYWAFFFVVFPFQLISKIR